MGLFNRKASSSASPPNEIEPESEPKTESSSSRASIPTSRNPSKTQVLPTYNHNGHLVTKGIHPDGESGRSGIHPLHFFRVAWRSSCTASKWVNVLWPFVPVAIALHFAVPRSPVWIFATNYIAMVPAANLIGFAGQELARKLPKVAGILLETALGSVVEIVLFMVLIKRSRGPWDVQNEHNLLPVIQAAILGSILTNLLLCLGLCFFVGGMKRHEQTFHAAISEVGSGLLLVAGFALLIPSAFYSALSSTTVEKCDAAYTEESFTTDKLQERTRAISHATSVVLIVAFAIYLWFNAQSHDSIFEEVLEADEARDEDRHIDLAKPKFTFTECIVALVVALTCVSMIAVFLVNEIPAIVKKGVPDNFMGLILVPLVEKTAEHLTAVDEAWDNQMNFALYHCLGPSIQTALFNAPLVVIVAWGLGKPLDLNFEIFMVVLLVLSILVVGNFLRDEKSNYLEGSLLVLVYVIVAVASWYYPNSDLTVTNLPDGLNCTSSTSLLVEEVRKSVLANLGQATQI